MSPSVEPTTEPSTESEAQVKSFSTFRFGQDVLTEDLVAAVMRVPLLYLAGKIIPKKSMQHGLEIVELGKDDKETLVEDLTREWKRYNWNPKIVQAAEIEANHGAVTISIHEPRDPNNGDTRELLAFSPEDSRLTVNEKGVIESYRLTEHIGCESKPDLKHYFPERTEKGEVANEKKAIEELKNVFHVCLRPAKFFWKGYPIWLALWDTAWAHYVSLESSMVTDVRVAYGIRKAYIHDRRNDPENIKQKNTMQVGLKSMESGDTAIILWSGIDAITNQPWRDEVDIEFGSGHYDSSRNFDTYHKVASFLLSIPKNFLDGIFAGETLAGDTIYRMIQEALVEFRLPWIPHLNRIGKRWAELAGKTWKDNYTFRWITPKAKLTEREQAEIELIEADREATLVNAGITDSVDARTHLKIENPNKVIEKPDVGLKIDGLNPNASDPKDKDKDIQEPKPGEPNKDP